MLGGPPDLLFPKPFIQFVLSVLSEAKTSLFLPNTIMSNSRPPGICTPIKVFKEKGGDKGLLTRERCSLTPARWRRRSCRWPGRACWAGSPLGHNKDLADGAGLGRVARCGSAGLGLFPGGARVRGCCSPHRARLPSTGCREGGRGRATQAASSPPGPAAGLPPPAGHAHRGGEGLCCCPGLEPPERRMPVNVGGGADAPLPPAGLGLAPPALLEEAASRFLLTGHAKIWALTQSPGDWRQVWKAAEASRLVA